MTKDNAANWSMDDIIAKKKAPTKRVTIQLNGDVQNEIAQLQKAVTDARMYDRKHNTPDTEPDAQAALDEAIERAQETEREFVFQSIGRKNYDDLVENHPPTEDQRKSEGAQFNTQTFPPALIAASALSPKITFDQAMQIFNDGSWNGAELLRLFYAALEVNTEAADTPLSVSGSAPMGDSVLNLLSQLGQESPTQST